MAIGLIGRKVGMTQIYDDSGQAIPVTVLQVGPCHVLQVRTKDRDGYEALQLGYLDKPRRLASRSERGHLVKLDSRRAKRRAQQGVEPQAKPACEPKREIHEFRDFDGEHEVGSQLTVELFSEIKSVDVIGTSKGRGTAGAMKRHGFSGQRASHGVKKVHRHVGSIGCSAYPSRVIKGRRMAGQYGNARSTVRNLKVVKVDPENNLIVVNGAVPGPNGGYILVRQTNRLPKPA